MNFPVDLLSALAIALLFAAAGELVLFRPSRSAPDLFESFAVGSGMAAALLFPLSLAAGKNALALTFVLLLMGVVASIALRFRFWRLSRSEAVARIDCRDPLSIIFLLLAAGATICFALLNWRMAYQWDGFQIWATLAQMLFVEGRVAPERFPEALYIGAKIRYPQLLPLYEALVAFPHGTFDFDRLKPLFLVFFSGMLVMTYTAVRRIGSSRLALAATALVGLLPALSTGTAIGGYADMPLAFFVVSLTAAVVSERSTASRTSAVPWLIGALCFVKDEGLILAAIAVAMTGLYWLMTRKSHKLLRRIADNWPAILISGSMILTRLAYLRWIDYQDNNYLRVSRETIPVAMARVPEVLSLGLQHLFEPRMWGLFWPAFFVGFIAVLRQGGHRERMLAISVFLAICVFHVIFLFTNWEVELHVQQALPRLLAQIAPAAAVVMAMAFTGAMKRLAK
ncbi:MAG TPA: hypothetical protein VMS12_05050 [Thermoanaerobaculia bacterium]|nr:hypothetical protein [Thermoanaerobaculia bacterium]